MGVLSSVEPPVKVGVNLYGLPVPKYIIVLQKENYMEIIWISLVLFATKPVW